MSVIVRCRQVTLYDDRLSCKSAQHAASGEDRQAAILAAVDSDPPEISPIFMIFSARTMLPGGSQVKPGRMNG